jgi:hypothetical protein
MAQASSFETYHMTPGASPDHISWPDTVAEVIVSAIVGKVFVLDRSTSVTAVGDMSGDNHYTGAVILQGQSQRFKVRTETLNGGGLYFASANTTAEGASVASVFVLAP